MAPALRSPKSLQPALLRYFRLLRKHFGAQSWWPGRTRFEIILGALLTQHTAWSNVEQALENLRSAGLLSPHKLSQVSLARLNRLLRPSGTYRQKSRMVRRFLRYLNKDYGGALDRMFRLPAWHLRAELLQLPGVGPETVDAILLYAGGHPAFVIDAYTRRILQRHGLAHGRGHYTQLQELFESQLPRDAVLYNEYHALLVAAGKTFCHSRNPDCASCPLGMEMEVKTG
jgi:endonuclease-3 related protein